MAKPRFQPYNYKGKTYTLDTVNFNMSVFEEEFGDEAIVMDARLVAEVITNGKKVTRQ